MKQLSLSYQQKSSPLWIVSAFCSIQKNKETLQNGHWNQEFKQAFKKTKESF